MSPVEIPSEPIWNWERIKTDAIEGIRDALGITPIPAEEVMRGLDVYQVGDVATGFTKNVGSTSSGARGVGGNAWWAVASAVGLSIWDKYHEDLYNWLRQRQLINKFNGETDLVTDTRLLQLAGGLKTFSNGDSSKPTDEIKSSVANDAVILHGKLNGKYDGELDDLSDLSTKLKNHKLSAREVMSLICERETLIHLASRPDVIKIRRIIATGADGKRRPDIAFDVRRLGETVTRYLEVKSITIEEVAKSKVRKIGDVISDAQKQIRSQMEINGEVFRRGDEAYIYIIFDGVLPNDAKREYEGYVKAWFKRRPDRTIGRITVTFILKNPDGTHSIVPKVINVTPN